MSRFLETLAKGIADISYAEEISRIKKKSRLQILQSLDEDRHWLLHEIKRIKLLSGQEEGEGQEGTVIRLRRRQKQQEEEEIQNLITEYTNTRELVKGVLNRQEEKEVKDVNEKHAKLLDLQQSVIHQLNQKSLQYHGDAIHIKDQQRQDMTACKETFHLIENRMVDKLWKLLVGEDTYLSPLLVLPPFPSSSPSPAVSEHDQIRDWLQAVSQARKKKESPEEQIKSFQRTAERKVTLLNTLRANVSQASVLIRLSKLLSVSPSDEDLHLLFYKDFFNTQSREQSEKDSSSSPLLIIFDGGEEEEKEEDSHKEPSDR
ncbi:hypothetical protein CSUI_007233, partial [Cystoisospora suis]